MSKDRNADGPEEPRGLVIISPDGTRRDVPLDDSLEVGRQHGDVTISDDTFLSSTHFSVAREWGRTVLRDLDSTNGTFVRVHGEIEVRPGDEVVIGRQVFRFVV